MATVLCVADEPSVGVLLEHTLARSGHRSVLVSSVEEAMQTVLRGPLDLIVADYRMPEHTALDLLAMLEKEGLRIPVIIMAGYSNIEQAVISIESGAIDYLTKPVRAEMLEIAVRRALEVVQLRRENDTLRRAIRKVRPTRAAPVGASEVYRRIMETIGTVAATPATVLLHGESGTGKELFARAIHDQSPRRDAPFVTINCATLPEELVQSAFTGAVERARGGTLVLDEVSGLRLDLQARLLRVIETQEVDVRFIATTRRDLEVEVDAGKFRRDLHDRLNVVSLRIPALRERREDIPLLIDHFVRRASERQGIPAPAIAPETIQLLGRYRWPGNVRELANAIERAVILCRAKVLQPSVFEEHLRGPSPTVSDLPTAAGAPADPMPFDLEVIERQAIGRALEATGGNRTRAAKLLGISDRTLRNKLNIPKSASGS